MGTLETHHHEGGGIGISTHAGAGQYGGRENVVLYGIARLRVDGMGIFALALVVEVAVVATGSHRLVGDVEHRLQLVALQQWVVSRFGDANLPGHAFLANTSCYNLSANLHHVVVDAFLFQQTRYSIHTVAFGNGRAVEGDAWIALDNLLAVVAYLLVADDSHQRVYSVLVGQLFVLKAKAPGVDQWTNGDIEGTIGVLANLLSLLEYLDKHTGQFCALIVVYTRDGALLVEHRQ